MFGALFASASRARTVHFRTRKDAMAKGQAKSNKEVRKPKKDKVAAKAATPFSATLTKEVPKLSGAKPKK